MAGATGVLGRALLPHLAGHRVVGLTRWPAKLDALGALGAEGVVCDVYDRDALIEAARAARPEIAVNLLTDLADGIGPGNDRIRREGGPNVVDAARAAGARRLVVESVSFPLPGAAGEALAELEQGALASGLEALVLRFALLWGPGTWYERAPDGPAVHVEEAGLRAADLVLHGAPGVHEITAAPELPPPPGGAAATPPGKR